MTESKQPESPHAEDSMEGYVGPEREVMPRDRQGVSHKVTIAGLEGYIIANPREDGRLGEVFLHGFGQGGSTMEGWTQGFAILLSIALQYGTPLDMLARKFAHMKFEPYGDTDNPDIPHCHSVPDYIFRWLAQHFGDEQLQLELGQIEKEMHD